jgi:acetyl-CoA C-acetyltransferase
MRPVYALSGGVSKFAKARPDKTFPALVKEAYDDAIGDLGLSHRQFVSAVDGSVASYFSDHFTRQLMAGIMVQDYLGLVPKPSHRVEGGAPPAASASRKPGRRWPPATWTSAWPMASRR